MPRKSFANQLRDHIRRHPETVTNIATGAGVPQPTLSRFLSGTRQSMNFDNLDRLLRYLNLEMRPKSAGRGK
jgi:predicted XRE-type DNA-binding protein